MENRLAIYDAVNKCETEKELSDVITLLSDSDGKIQGRTRKFDSIEMIVGLKLFMEGSMHANVLTREYGIRQQAIYLKYCLE